jgi:hypothetical protein
MAYTLKSTGIATDAIMVVAVDEDGTTIKEFVSPSVNSNKTVDTGVVVSSATWQGVSRGYFETVADGSFDYDGVRFGVGNRPLVDLDATEGAAGSSVFFACAGMSAGASDTIRTIIDLNGASFYGRRVSDNLHASALGNLTAGTTALPTNGTTKFSAGYVHNHSGTERYFYGLDGGALATDGTGADDGRGAANAPMLGIGGVSGGHNLPAKYFIVAVFDRELTTVEFQSLHTDWFGTLFESGEVQLLAPIQDISAGTWLTSSGSPAELWQMIDGEKSPDTDYDYTTSAGTMEVKFAPGSTPSLQTGHTLRYRLRGNGTCDALVKLKVGSTVLAQWTETNVPAVDTDYSHTLDSSPSFTISDYTDLRISVEAVP